MKKCLSIILTSLLIVFCFSFNSVRGDTKDNYRESIVQLFAIRNGHSSYGSAFFVDDKILATNYHVINDAKRIIIFTNGDEDFCTAEVIATDIQNDIALLKVDSLNDYPELKFSTNVKKNESVLTCGFAGAYEMTYGKVNLVKDKYEGNYYIDISNICKHGNSGGPAINSDGLVIGMVTLGNSKSTSLVPSFKIIDLMNNLESL